MCIGGGSWGGAVAPTTFTVTWHCRYHTHSMEHFRVSLIYQPQYILSWQFSGVQHTTQKADEDYCLQHSKPSTTGTTELLSWEQLDTLDHLKHSDTWLPLIATVRSFTGQSRIAVIFLCYINIVKSCLNTPKWAYLSLHATIVKL